MLSTGSVLGDTKPENLHAPMEAMKNTACTAKSGGWLMSVLSTADIVLAIFAGLLPTLLGPKVAGLIASGFTVLGASAEQS